MAVVRRKWTAAKRAKVVAYAAKHGKTAAMAHYRVSGSMVYAWMQPKSRLEWHKNNLGKLGLVETKPEGGRVRYDNALVNQGKSSVSHAVVVLLKQSDRAFKAGHATKAHLLAMLALETLEGR